MTIVMAINIFLVLICLLLIVYGGGRKALRDKQRYEQVQADPATGRWLQANLSGNNLADIRAIRQQFGLPAHHAKDLLQQHQATRKQV